MSLVYFTSFQLKNHHFTKEKGTGARFSKAPIINRPVKLLLFKWKIEV